jgi:hypothetical protein
MAALICVKRLQRQPETSPARSRECLLRGGALGRTCYLAPQCADQPRIRTIMLAGAACQQVIFVAPLIRK